MLQFNELFNDLFTEMQRIGTGQEPQEFRELLLFMEPRPRDNALEIGVDHGATLYAWRELFTGSVVGIDNLSYGNIPRIDMTNISMFLGTSHDETLPPRLIDLIQKPFDFLFIDGDHTYDGVKLDFDYYSPLVAEGGIVAFHDIMHLANGCGVPSFWNRIKHRYDHREFFTPGTDSDRGIGILIV